MNRTENHSRSSLWPSILATLVLALLLWDKLVPPKWEYMIQAVPDQAFQEEMNKLGGDGWEAISARRASSGAESVFSYEIIFRRRKL